MISTCQDRRGTSERASGARGGRGVILVKSPAPNLPWRYPTRELQTSREVWTKIRRVNLASALFWPASAKITECAVSTDIPWQSVLSGASQLRKSPSGGLHSKGVDHHDGGRKQSSILIGIFMPPGIPSADCLLSPRFPTNISPTVISPCRQTGAPPRI